MIKIISVGTQREQVEVKLETTAKFRYGTFGDISFWLELDGNNLYTTYNPSLNFTVGSIRLATLNKLLVDVQKMSDIPETRRWKDCCGVGLYGACYEQARIALCDSLYSNRARELKQEISNTVRKRRSPLELSLDRLERIFDKYENFTTTKAALDLEVEKWEKEVDAYQEDENQARKTVCSMLQEYFDIRNNILGKVVRSEHLFTVRVEE